MKLDCLDDYSEKRKSMSRKVDKGTDESEETFEDRRSKSLFDDLNPVKKGLLDYHFFLKVYGKSTGAIHRFCLKIDGELLPKQTRKWALNPINPK